MDKKSTTNIECKIDVESQTSPIRENSSQVSGSDTVSLLENQSRSTTVQCPIDSKKKLPEIQRHENDMTTHASGDDNISHSKITTSQTEERLVSDDTTNELYMPLSSTALKRKKEKLYVPLDFENGLTKDAFVDSGSRHPKILECLRITNQSGHEYSKKLLNSKTRENSTHKRAQNLKTNFSNDLIGPTRLQQKQRNKQLNIFWSTIMRFSPDTESIL